MAFAGLPAVLWICLLSAILAEGARELTLPDGTSALMEVFESVPGWRIASLWKPWTVNVTCANSKDFVVYAASSPEQLAAEYGRGQTIWCGLARALYGGQTCIAQISPFQDTVVTALRPGSGGRLRCTFEVSERFSGWRLVRLLAGVVLFLNSAVLIASPIFRLGTGAAGFVALSSAIVLFIVYRSVPNKKRLAGAAALLGSTFWGAVRCLFGTWLPSIGQLLLNKWVVGYVLVAGLAGMAVTYYYDDPANVKLNTILRHGLRVLGLALVATSTTWSRASLGLAAALFAAQLTHTMALPRLQELKRLRQEAEHAIASMERACLGAERAIIGRRWGHLVRSEPASGARVEEEDAQLPKDGGSRMESRSARKGHVVSPTTPLGEQHHNERAHVSPLVQRGLLYNEATGRTIHIGKATYHRLVDEGFKVDEQRGTITPPPTHTTKASPTSSR